MKGQSYNEKVDVFSFAIIIFELLSFRVAMAAIGDHRDLDYEAVHAHAEEVSHGYRLPLPARWPFPIQALIRDCWNHKSSLRPSFAVIEQRLQEIQVSSCVSVTLSYPQLQLVHQQGYVQSQELEAEVCVIGELLPKGQHMNVFAT